VHHDYLQLTEGGRRKAVGESLDALQEELEATFKGQGKADLPERIVENFERYRALAARDRENMARLTERLDQENVITVPYLDEDVHDLGGLAHVNRYLFASSEERKELLASVAV
jgi:hypothetical protein